MNQQRPLFYEKKSLSYETKGDFVFFYHALLFDIVNKSITVSKWYNEFFKLTYVKEERKLYCWKYTFLQYSNIP